MQSEEEFSPGKNRSKKESFVESARKMNQFRRHQLEIDHTIINNEDEAYFNYNSSNKKAEGIKENKKDEEAKIAIEANYN